MYATLHGAFGTWPTESHEAFTIRSASKDVRPSALNETFDFESENNVEPGRPVFSFKPENWPSDRVFIPPYFVPPGATRNPGIRRPAEAGSQDQVRSNPRSIQSSEERVNARSARQTIPVAPSNYQEAVPSLRAEMQDQQLDSAVPFEPVQSEQATLQDMDTRSPWPLSTPVIDRKRAELWSPEARKAFHDMVTGPGYINRYRLHMKKRERMMQYLQNPDREPLLCDGSRDHQTKYQAAHWTVVDGKLYRKPESGRVARYRRHLDDFEAWDVLTMEHMRSGHLGRDKLRKVLEQNYIGYTLQEIMFVLKECKKCASRTGNSERQNFGNDVEMEDSVDVSTTNMDHEGSGRQMSSPTPTKGPYGREQTSNFMWF